MIARGKSPSAAAAFHGLHQLESLRRRAEAQWALMDVLVLPTTPTIFSIADAAADLAATSARLGLYTNFVNLLDLAALALPAGFLPAPRNTPFGISLIALACSEPNLLALGERFFPDQRGGVFGAHHPESPDAHAQTVFPHALEPERPPRTLICVVGAHLSGQPLNHQLTELDGQLVRRTRTAPLYRLYALAGTAPPKPGLLRVGTLHSAAAEPTPPGIAIDVEVWSLPNAAVGSFLARVPPPLCLGNIQLDTGEHVKGFLCETYALPGATDISHFGGWLSYLARSA